MKLVLVIAVLLLTGCSAGTRYSLEIDIVSFIPEEERSREWIADDGGSTERYRVIFLPYSEELFRESEPIGVELQKGFELDVPVPDDPGVEDIVLSLHVDAEVFNRSSSGVFREAAFHLRAAPAAVENVYTDGTVMLSFDALDISPGESVHLRDTRTVRRGDPGFDILSTGRARIGLEGLFWSDADVSMEYRLNEMRIRVSVRPFSLIP